LCVLAWQKTWGWPWHLETPFRTCVIRSEGLSFSYHVFSWLESKSLIWVHKTHLKICASHGSLWSMTRHHELSIHRQVLEWLAKHCASTSRQSSTHYQFCAHLWRKARDRKHRNELGIQTHIEMDFKRKKDRPLNTTQRALGTGAML
jgi:hypothetical protein